MTFQTWFATQVPGVSLKSAESVLNLTSEGATLPFIARYRKEATGGLDEVQIQNVLDAKEEWDTVTSRQAYILGEIEKQGKLTDELKAKISSTFEATLLEDLYLPYKVKKKSKATLAKEAGLGELAEWIWGVGHGTVKPEEGQTLAIWALAFKNDDKGFPDVEKIMAGAESILIERLSENAELRMKVREAMLNEGSMKTSKAEKAKANSKYEMYFSYHEPITNLRKPENSHRYLAIRRGWMEEELKIDLGGAPGDEAFESDLLKLFENEAMTDHAAPDAVVDTLRKCAKTAFKAHVLPAIENEAHKAMKEVADVTAIRVFAENVRKLLLSSPFGPKAVLGVDPGIRTGCKLAVINDSGKFVGDTVIHLQSEEQKTKAKELLGTILKMGDIKAIAVGNGTAGRETESFLRAVVKENGVEVPVVMVNESGASVYSASEAAREEFPEQDVTVRGAISIARRLQDPLAELVKIEPKSIGVGQYQHDVSPNSLKKSLELVVDVCVNSVGVNLNTASYHLLARVAGIGPALAKAIVEHRGATGIFKSRKALLDVPRFSTKAFEQAAGFLRIPESEHPLDNTGVHPERYETLEKVAKAAGKEVKDLMGSDGVKTIKANEQLTKVLREKFGEFTFDDILKELEKPGRDPRDAFIPFSYRDDIFTLKDLKPGMIAPGIVTNVTNFGAFVDIGVHQDGLVHISQLANKFVKDPRDVVSPGDRVTVKVLEILTEKNQIALTMKMDAATAEAPAKAYDGENRIGKPQPRGGDRNDDKGRGHHRGRDNERTAGAPNRIGNPSPKMPLGPPKPQFKNNPFASALAGIKKDLKN